MDPDGRYSRQELFKPIGVKGQRKLGRARVVVVGCGALGSNLCDKLVRAGVGNVRIIDCDRLELSNLQRQTLFDERDVEQSLPKAQAAAERLRQINSTVEIEALFQKLTSDNALELLRGADVVLDGLDNMQGR